MTVVGWSFLEAEPARLILSELAFALSHAGHRPLWDEYNFKIHNCILGLGIVQRHECIIASMPSGKFPRRSLQSVAWRNTNVSSILL